MKSIVIALCIIAVTLAKYNPSVSLQLATLSAISYSPITQIDTWSCPLCSKYKIALPKSFVNLTTNTHGFTGFSASLNAIVVVFRGTQNPAQWLLELKSFFDTYSECNNCFVNREFYAGYLSVKPALINQIESLRKLYRNAGIYITGHGFGGALAILSAVELKALYAVIDTVYTFGAPRVGNLPFSTFYTALIPQTYRVVNNADIVPHVPLSTSGYFHSSWQEWYTQAMTVRKECEGESSGCAAGVPGNQLNTNDNDITSYMQISDNLSINQISQRTQILKGIIQERRGKRFYQGVFRK